MEVHDFSLRPNPEITTVIGVALDRVDFVLLPPSQLHGLSSAETPSSCADADSIC
jgi:hypothetical protein